MSVVLPLAICMPHNLSLLECHSGSFLVQVFQYNRRFPFIIYTSICMLSSDFEALWHYSEGYNKRRGKSAEVHQKPMQANLVS